MLDKIRTPFFIAALILLAFVVLIEIGSPWFMRVSGGNFDLPGYGIQYLSFVDSFLLYVTVLMGLALIIPEKIQGRLQGCATAIFSFFGCLGIITAIIFALIFLLVLISLLMAVPFGTLAYFAVYGHFDRSGANVILSLIMFLKIGYAVFLLLAHQRFLQNKSLVLLVLTSLLCNLIISFLHNFMPRPFVSILDTVGALVVAIIAIIWAVIFLIMSIISIVKAIR